MLVTFLVILHITSNLSKLCNLLTSNRTMPSLGGTHHVIRSWFTDIGKNNQHNKHSAWKAKQHWNFHLVRNFVIFFQNAEWICPSLCMTLVCEYTVQRITQPNWSEKNPVVFASACLLFSLNLCEATSPSLHELAMAPFLFWGGQSYTDKNFSFHDNFSFQ